MIKLERPECPNPTALQNGNYCDSINKAALIGATHGKCMYCESCFTHTEYGDVEHFRPKAAYPHLEFEWSNLGVACTKCNRENKRNQFDETTPYIDPFSEDPAEHIIAAGAYLSHKRGSERGELTIIDIGLNRNDLIEKRRTHMEKIQKEIDRCMRSDNATLRGKALTALRSQAGPKNEYSLVASTVFKLHDIE